MSPVSFADLQLVAPILILFVFGLLTMVAPVARPGHKASPSSVLGLSLTGLFAALISTVLLIGQLSGPTSAFGGLIAVDDYALFAGVVILLAAIGTAVLGHDYLRRVDVLVPEYHALLLFSVMGMLLMVAAADLILLFISLELMSIALYVLVGINRGEWTSVEGAFKYLVLGAFASGVLLYGIAFVYGAVGSTHLSHVSEWLNGGHALTASPLLATGLALMLVGFCFKIAAAPFHMWSPDVYEGAPVPVTALMSTGVKVAAFAALGRVLFSGFLVGAVEWAGPLAVVSGLTILVGNVAALAQSDLKRMLAYSSVAHAGYLLMAVVAAPAAGLSDNPQVSGLLVYLLAYAIMNIGAFAALSLMTRDGADDTRIERLAGLGRTRPAVAAALAVCLLSLAGIPPTLGFVGKFYLFAAALNAGAVGLAVVGAIGGALGVFYYLRPVVLMYMRPPVGEPVDVPGRGAVFALGGAAVALVLLGLVPGPLVEWARASVLGMLVG